MPIAKSIDEIIEEFNSLYEIDQSTGCWIWIGNTDKDGYGTFRGRSHRFSYTYYKGEIPKGMCVCHTCDNPSCVNPDHLWLGTNLDNIKDRDTKGRTSKGENHPAHLNPEQNRGSNNPRAKVTDEQVREIRRRYKRTSYNRSNRAELATEFGLSRSVIKKIILRTLWKHLDD